MTREAIRRSTQTAREDPQLLRDEGRALDQAVALAGKNKLDEAHLVPVLEQLRQYLLHGLLQHLNKEEQDFFPAVRHLGAGGQRSGAAGARARHAASGRRELLGFPGAEPLCRRSDTPGSPVANQRRGPSGPGDLEGTRAFEADLVWELQARVSTDRGVGDGRVRQALNSRTATVARAPRGARWSQPARR